MKDKAVQGLAKAASKGKLAREGENASRNKRGVGKRSNYGGGLSSSLASGSGQINVGRNIASTLRGGGKSLSKQQKQQQNLQKAIKVAKKIPVLNKYAKIAKAAQKVASMKNKGGKIFGGFSGGGSASKDEAEDLLAAEQKGEEYKPDQSEQKITVFTKRQLIISAVLICSGIFIVLILIAVITLSSITDTAGEAYLASKNNPTEEELAEAYGSQDDGSEGDDSSDGDSLNLDKVKKESTKNLVLVGDSRTVGLCMTVEGTSQSNCETIGYTNNSRSYISKGSMGYDWLSKTALPNIKKQLDTNSKQTVFINMGTNGLDHVSDYAKIYNDLASSYKNSNIVVVSVTPIDDSKVTSFKDIENDANVVKFNSEMRKSISSDVIYCDVYSKIKDNFSASDGIHYDSETYKRINDAMNSCLNGSSSSGSGSLNASKTLTPNNNKPSGVYEVSSEPEPWAVINYFDNLNKDDFVYPVDKNTNLKLGAWPKNYKKIPTQLSGCKVYQGAYIWPTTPSNGKYDYVYPHNGIDIMADFGTPIYSPVDGTLVYSEWGHTSNKGSDETAYSVTITPDKVVSYGGIKIDEIFMTHMSGIRYRCEWGKCNKKVKKGELLGFVGTAAGNSTSPGYASHLHMTLYPSSNYSSGIRTPTIEKFYNISSGTKRKVCE